MKIWMIAVPLTLTVAVLGACADGTGKAEAVTDKGEVVQAEGKKVKEGSEKEEPQGKQVKELSTYEKVVLEDKDGEREVTVEYPYFGYEKLDRLIEEEMESTFEGQIDSLEKLRQELSSDGFEDENFTKYFFNRTMEEPIITDEVVSIYFRDYLNTGGQGVMGSVPINFDLKKERVLTLEEVLKEHETSLDIIAEALRDKLMTDERFAQYRHDAVGDYAAGVAEETSLEEMERNAFTLQEDSITFYHQYYSIFPNAEGIVGIELKWSELEDYPKKNHDEVNNYRAYSFGEQVKPAKSLTYHDKDFGFSFAFPPSWKNHYMLQIPDSSDLFEPYQPSKVIQLSMVDEGKFIGRLVTIGVLEGVTQEEMEDYYEGSLGTEAFMAAGNDLVLVYSIPYEPPGQTHEEEYWELGEQYLQMVQGDMDKIVESVKFE